MSKQHFTAVEILHTNRSLIRLNTAEIDSKGYLKIKEERECQ